MGLISIVSIYSGTRDEGPLLKSGLLVCMHYANILMHLVEQLV